jgi:hypothetical protein
MHRNLIVRTGKTAARYKTSYGKDDDDDCGVSLWTYVCHGGMWGNGCNGPRIH